MKAEFPIVSRIEITTVRTGSEPGGRPVSTTPVLFGTTVKKLPLRIVGTASNCGSLEASV